MTCSAVWQLCRSISLKAVVNLLTERQTLEDGDYMHKAAKQAGAASLMEQPAAVSTSQGTFDTQENVSTAAMPFAPSAPTTTSKYEAGLMSQWADGSFQTISFTIAGCVMVACSDNAS